MDFAKYFPQQPCLSILRRITSHSIYLRSNGSLKSRRYCKRKFALNAKGKIQSSKSKILLHRKFSDIKLLLKNEESPAIPLRLFGSRFSFGSFSFSEKKMNKENTNILTKFNKLKKNCETENCTVFPK